MLWTCWGATLCAEQLCKNTGDKPMRHAIMVWHAILNVSHALDADAEIAPHSVQTVLMWNLTPSNSKASRFFLTKPLWAKDTQRLWIPALQPLAVSRAVHLCVPRSFIFGSISYLSCYLQQMAICRTSVCFLFNGEHQQSDAIRAALMTGWLPNPARFHALLMITCQIRHWNREIRDREKREWKIERSGISNWGTRKDACPAAAGIIGMFKCGKHVKDATAF